MYLYEPLAHPPLAVVSVQRQVRDRVPQRSSYLVERVERTLYVYMYVQIGKKSEERNRNESKTEKKMKVKIKTKINKSNE